MSVKDFFGRLMNRVGFASRGGIVEPTPGSSTGGCRIPVAMRKSCRKRGWGMKRADGKWMSPWDLYLTKVQMDKAQDPELVRETPLSFGMVFGKQGDRCVARYAMRRA